MKHTFRSLLLLLLLWAVWPTAGLTQDGRNPFELIPRLDPKEASAAVDDLSRTRGTGNPFDLLVAPEKTPALLPGVEPARRAPLDREERFRRFFFVATVVFLLLLASLLTLFRGYFQKTLRAFLSDNMLNQAQRDQESGRSLPFLLFYGFFFLNAGLYLYLLTAHYGYQPAAAPFSGFLICLAAVTLLFLAKHILLSLIGFIFPVQKEARIYSFMIVIFSIILGILLLPLNLLIVYGPEDLAGPLVLISFGLIATVYLFRSLRALFMAGQYLAFHTFHFLLYICTVEIAPVAVIIKLIIRQL